MIVEQDVSRTTGKIISAKVYSTLPIPAVQKNVTWKLKHLTRKSCTIFIGISPILTLKAFSFKAW